MGLVHHAETRRDNGAEKKQRKVMQHGIDAANRSAALRSHAIGHPPSRETPTPPSLAPLPLCAFARVSSSNPPRVSVYLHALSATDPQRPSTSNLPSFRGFLKASLTTPAVRLKTHVHGARAWQPFEPTTRTYVRPHGLTLGISVCVHSRIIARDGWLSRYCGEKHISGTLHSARRINGSGVS